MSNYLTDYLLRAKTSVSLTRDLLLEIFATHGRHFIIAESKTLLKSQFYIFPRKFIYVQPLTYVTHSWSRRCKDVLTNVSLDGAHASPAKINEETVCLSEYTNGMRDLGFIKKYKQYRSRGKSAMPVSKLPLCTTTSSRSLHRPALPSVILSPKLSVLFDLTFINRLANNVTWRTL